MTIMNMKMSIKKSDEAQTNAKKKKSDNIVTSSIHTHTCTLYYTTKAKHTCKHNGINYKNMS